MDFISVLRALLLIAGAVALVALAWFLIDLRSKLGEALVSLKSTLANVDRLSKQLSTSGVVDQARSTLADATQTSQSVRARIDDLAATQRELHDTSVALADLATQLRDQPLGVKVGNVLSDASTLMADIGMLTENASSVLDSGKPLVENASAVLGSAKRGVRSIAGGTKAVKEGFKAGLDTLRGEDD